MLRVLTILTCLVTFAACSLTNPHVRWGKPSGPGLDAAMDYAANAKERYKKAVGDQALLTNGLGVGLIPMGAAVLGLAATGGSSAAMTALGLTGAAGFGTGMWLSSRPRQFVYIEGIKALTCAVDAIRPLGTVVVADLDSALDALDAAIGDVQSQIVVVQGKAAALPPSGPGVLAARSAKADVDAAQRAVDDGMEVLTAGYALKQQVNGAGIALIQAVDRIGAEVDRAIVTTLPDLQSLPAVIGGLAQLSTQFGAVGVPQTPAMEGAARMDGVRGELQAEQLRPIEELNAELAKLKILVAHLGRRARVVAAIVNNVGAAAPIDALKACNVADVATSFTVEPAALQFKAGADATKTVVIAGGKPPYFAEALDDPMEGLVVRPPGPTGARVDVIAKNPVEGGPYTVLVRDTAGHSRRVSVGVVAAPPSQGADSRRSGATTTGVTDFTEAERATVRAALCAPPDAPWDGEAMRALVRVFQEAVGSAPGPAASPLTREQRAVLAKAPPCKPDRRNYVENQLEPDEIRAIQAQIGLPPAQRTGQLTAQTRARLRDFKGTIGLTADDQIRAGDVNRILAAEPARPS